MKGEKEKLNQWLLNFYFYIDKISENEAIPLYRAMELTRIKEYIKDAIRDLDKHMLVLGEEENIIRLTKIKVKALYYMIVGTKKRKNYGKYI